MVTTMLGVAKCVGISKATVSRVLSGNGCIGQETKDCMFQAVEENGHHPSLLARNLSVESTQTLGLAVTNAFYHGIYFSELLSHAARIVEEKRRQLLLVGSKYSIGEERQAIQYLLGLRCDAIMIYPCFLSVDEINDIVDAHSWSIVVLNHRLCKNSNHSAWCDHKQTSFSAVAELINAEHQEIAFPTGSMGSPTNIERLIGYRDVLTQHNITLSERPIANGKWTPASGAEGVEMLLERGAKFSALVASNDDMAIGVMETLHEHGVAVPEQVSVVGFDDTAIAPYTVPALSSVKISVTGMIQEIIGQLISMLDGGGLSPSKTFSGKLIRHGSLIALSR